MATITSKDIQKGSSRLRDHFAATPASAHGRKWDELWEENFIPWDKGKPSPALVDLLEEGTLGQSFLEDPVKGLRRKRALVPGCGKGYDVLLLSAFGYDAYGLEISDIALSTAKEWERTKKDDDDYRVRNAAKGRGQITWLAGNFFENEFLKDVEGDGTFDLLYDYTFLAALAPEMRPAWARRYSELLSPTGHLVCLEFPTYKDPSLGGPPWALPPEIYMAHLPRPGQKLAYSGDGRLQEDRLGKATQDGLSRIAHFRPKRTHPVGMDADGNVADWISIWTH